MSELTNRREYRQGRFVYLLDDNDRTAWILSGHIGRCKTYRVPSSVDIEGVRYTITSVELGAYKCPRTLQHLIFPDTIEYIDEDEFCNLPNLRSVHIGKGVQYLLNWHFRCCPKLHAITIDPLNPHLKMQNGLVLTTDGTILLRSLFPRRDLHIPEGVKYVEKVAFWYDDKMENITFPSSIREISDNSFSNIPNLKRVVIPEGLEKLIVQCFMDNENLEYVDLPSTVKYMGGDAFENCPNLKTLILRSPGLLMRRMSDFDQEQYDNCHLYVPSDYLESYRTHSVFGQFKHIHSIHEIE